LFLFWLALVGTLDPLELAAGAIAAAIAATAGQVVRAKSDLPRAASAADLLPHAWRAFARVPREFAYVAAALARRGRPHGAFRTIELEAGGDWRIRGRRGIAALIVSLPPNTFVVEVDAERGTALVHELVPQRSSAP
jgi:multisubunit Na+/H+ antiporter MnhE subunit